MSINKKIKERSYKLVRKYEKENGREVGAENYEKDGYDLKSQSATEIRHIEVKGSKSDAIASRWLEEKQFQNIQKDPDFFVYIVKKVFSEKPELLELSPGKLKKIKFKELKHYVFTNKQLEGCGPWNKV
jgi:transcription termination factor NusB